MIKKIENCRRCLYIFRLNRWKNIIKRQFSHLLIFIIGGEKTSYASNLNS